MPGVSVKEQAHLCGQRIFRTGWATDPLLLKEKIYAELECCAAKNISNPHFHVMCPIRPIESGGRWGNKQRREYVLDEHGERVLDEAGNCVFNAVPTTDWSSPDTLEHWRQAWAEMCNAKFAEKGLDCRIDHRSFARQGVEQIPTQHEGPTVRAMEAKGIRTDKGNLNRFIRKTNALLREAKEKIAALIGWLKDVKAELAKPQPPTLNDLLALHCANRNKGAYSNEAKNANLQRYAEAFSFLQSKNLYTVDDLDNTLHAMQDKIDTLKKSASSKQARIKEVDELLRMVDYYKSGKPAADKLKSIRFEKVEDIVKTAITYADESPERAYHVKSKWIVFYGFSLLICCIGTFLNYTTAQPCMETLETLALLSAVFGAYFCCFVRTKLSSFYDENSVNIFYDGPFRMNVSGVKFNNRNWPHIVRTLRLSLCLYMILFPIINIVAGSIVADVWENIGKYVFLAMFLCGVLLPIYVVGKKYE